MINRRQTSRLALSGCVEVLRNSREKIEVSAMNLGSGGIGVYSPVELGFDEEVTLTLYFIDHLVGRIPESLTALVKWVKPVGNHYEIGFQFKFLDPDYQALLLSYMGSRQKEQSND